MKLTKKLIPAFAMLLVSAVLMSTASFAWFSMNTQVTATGISVTAQAPKTLLISNNSTDFGATVALTNSNDDFKDEISPVTAYTDSSKTALLAGNAFYKLTSKSLASVNSAGALTGDAASAPVADNDYYDVATTTDVYKAQLWLKVEGTNATQTLQVQPSFVDGSTTEEIKKAFHVLFVFEGGTFVDFDMSTATAIDLCDIVGNAAATKVTVFVYLDGTDSDCKNANITAKAIANITLTFSFK